MTMMTRVKSAEERMGAAILEAIGKQAGAKGMGFKHDATGTPTSIYAHGPGGVFSYPGVDPQVFSAMLGVEAGLIGQLPKFPSLYSNPLYSSITGVQGDVGTEPDGVCDPAVVAGLMKTCMQTSVFGRYRRQTRELYMNRMGVFTDPADPNYLRLMNSYAQPDDPFLSPQMVPNYGSEVLVNELAKVLFEFGASVNRLLDRQMFNGNPANNTGGDGYREMTGVDLLVGTGKVDAISGVACPALDSDVKDFAHNQVDGGTLDIVEYCTYLYRYLRTNARKSGMLPVEWVWVMREELFYELTAVWPCSYLTYRCSFLDPANGGQRINVDARDAVDFRDMMRRENWLLIDGQRIPVILDDGIDLQDSTNTAGIQAGCFASDIYLLPLTVLGGTPVLYLEYFQHNNPSIDAALMNPGRLNSQVWTTNDGAWIWTMERSRLCTFWEGKVEPRLVLRTPQLAGKIESVGFCPLQMTRSPFPDSPYFKDGGVTSRPGPSYWTEYSE